MQSFQLRRTVERLRSGLFDHLAAVHLTMEEEKLVKNFSRGLQALEQGKSGHLCICGSYGQGKSHNLTYLHQKALAQGYAVSSVQLDLREIPFHQFSVVYQILMQRLLLPDGETFANVWKKYGEKSTPKLPDWMPHRFRMILIAMLCKNQVPGKKSKAKQEKGVRPKDASQWLEKSLVGDDLPLSHLKQILELRGVEGYRQQSLVCRDNMLYLRMVQALGFLLKEMGYKGLVLFFDEAESITQLRVKSRSKSYELLHEFFQGGNHTYPVFAFTNDFFDLLNREKYLDEKGTFSINYAEAWKELNIEWLQEPSAKKWDILQHRLIDLYAEAYQVDLSDRVSELKEKLRTLLNTLKVQEIRLKLKALVNQLDIETQSLFLR